MGRRVGQAYSQVAVVDVLSGMEILGIVLDSHWVIRKRDVGHASRQLVLVLIDLRSEVGEVALDLVCISRIQWFICRF